jgi:hypothetical protein
MMRDGGIENPSNNMQRESQDEVMRMMENTRQHDKNNPTHVIVKQPKKYKGDHKST